MGVLEIIMGFVFFSLTFSETTHLSSFINGFLNEEMWFFLQWVFVFWSDECVVDM